MKGRLDGGGREKGGRGAEREPGRGRGEERRERGEGGGGVGAERGGGGKGGEGGGVESGRGGRGVGLFYLGPWIEPWALKFF